ncbi:hypothetical protein [Myroides sp. DW712]|uniref:hypothetical protein n=1 Tax=Myroides sp. DW712 TaxID=3389800 RepID=UPI00397B0D8D
MKYTILLSLFMICVFTASFGQSRTVDQALFAKVIHTLEQDNESVELFKNLYDDYILDLRLANGEKEAFFEHYVRLYNEGRPLVRLIKKEALTASFSRLVKTEAKDKKDKCYKAYIRLIKNRTNYNRDTDIGGAGEQYVYFCTFLEQYMILPETK